MPMPSPRSQTHNGISRLSIDDRMSCTTPASATSLACRMNPRASSSCYRPVAAGKPKQTTNLVENRHGLIGTANLDLEIGGLVSVAVLVGALLCGLVGIFPGARAAEDILALLALELLPREERLVRGDRANVRTRAALEPVAAAVAARDGQDVGAVWTDCCAP